MPLLEVSMWKGFDERKKEKLIKELTEVIVRIVECPSEAVQIIIREVPQENWASGGVQHSKKFRREG